MQTANTAVTTAANAAVNTTSILAQLLAIAPDARPTNKMRTHTSKRDTLPEARSKVIDKLKQNIAYFIDNTQEKPDLVYVLQSDRTFTVGAKYGNRFLRDIITIGKHALNNVQEAQVVSVLEKLVQIVARGDCDPAIEAIMQKNVAQRNSK